MRGLIDIGANLVHDSFDHDRDLVIQRAYDAGVTRLIVTGSTLESSRSALALARNAPGRLFATVGVHPHHAVDFGPDAAEGLIALATRPECVAIGECGLDYYRNLSPPAAQRLAFDRQLSLAATTGKPVFLHQRDAHDDFVAMLREHRSDIVGGVAHCFTGDSKQMHDYLQMDLYIGVTGWICDERRGEALREAVAQLPLDRVMLETDAPYLLPRNLPDSRRSRRNEPALLLAVLDMTAQCMGVEKHVLAEAATRNTERLFGLPAA